MKKANAAILALALLVSASFAKDKTEIQKDMAAQEAAMSTIQKGLLYSSKDIVTDGVKALKEANKAGSLKDHLPTYLPDGKKALYKNAMHEGDNVNKHADAMLKALNENRFKDAFEAYGKTLNACNTCHLVIRSWK